jgi:hypothetical protein
MSRFPSYIGVFWILGLLRTYGSKPLRDSSLDVEELRNLDNLDQLSRAFIAVVLGCLY